MIPNEPEKAEEKAKGLAKADAKEKERVEVPATALSPEEQMARYEESLKESDWGHQPC